MLFKKKDFSDSNIDFLIVGLGNPGSKYEGTRHNAGFICVDKIAENLQIKVNKLKFKSLIGSGKIGDKKALLMKPSTFMNLSGQAVVEAMNFYKLKPDQVLVIFDDISLDVGSMRIRRSGSHGGHNGMKNIIYLSGSDQFPRIKIGVGAKPNPEYDLADWVLSKFGKDDTEQLKVAITKATEVLPFILDGEIDKAMNKAN